jgi:hypothetical protein
MKKKKIEVVIERVGGWEGTKVIGRNWNHHIHLLRATCSDKTTLTWTTSGTPWASSPKLLITHSQGTLLQMLSLPNCSDPIHTKSINSTPPYYPHLGHRPALPSPVFKAFHYSFIYTCILFQYTDVGLVLHYFSFLVYMPLCLNISIN